MSEYIDTESVEAGIELTSDPSCIGKRADAFIAERTGLTRSTAVRLIENGSILVCGKSFQKNYKIREGDVFSVETGGAESERR